MTMPLERRLFTVAKYLAMEELARDKHEFHDGEILAMSGGTFEASRIAVNLVAVLVTRLRGSPCVPLESNMRVRIGRKLNYVYPDASIVCGPPAFDPDDRKRTTILNPRVVFEVLSESTEAYDRGRKFSLYREVESMEEYVLLSQAEPLIETFRRHSDGNWQITVNRGIDALAPLRSVNIDLPLAEVYAGIEFPLPGGASAGA